MQILARPERYYLVFYFIEVFVSRVYFSWMGNKRGLQLFHTIMAVYKARILLM